MSIIQLAQAAEELAAEAALTCRHLLGWQGKVSRALEKSPVAFEDTFDIPPCNLGLQILSALKLTY